MVRDEDISVESSVTKLESASSEKLVQKFVKYGSTMSISSTSLFTSPASKSLLKRLNFHQVGDAGMRGEEEEAYSLIVDR